MQTNISKVIIDSSIWVSYFLGLKKNAPICKKIDNIIEKTTIILIPEIIYAEVLNVMIRLGHSERTLSKIKKTFKEKNYLRYGHKPNFWFKKLEFYMKKIRLHTQDLIIIASTFEHWPCELISSDKKLNEAYHFLKRYYEKNSIKKQEKA